MLQVKLLHYSCGRHQYKYKHRVRSRTTPAETRKGVGFDGVGFDAVHEQCSVSNFH